MDITKGDLTYEQLEDGKYLTTGYSDILSKGDHDVRHTDKVQHRIDLHKETPFKQRYQRTPPSTIRM